MITTTWKTDTDKGPDFLECKKEEFGNEPRENRVDTVKVYFYSKFDVDTIKGRNLEMSIAKAIFVNREKYGSVIDAYLDVYPNTIHFRTGTDAQIYNQFCPIYADRVKDLKLEKTFIDEIISNHEKIGGKE